MSHEYTPKYTYWSKVSGWVYFLESQANLYIKIGWTVNLDRRFRTISTMSPVPIKVLGVMAGGEEVERKVHFRFSESCHHGEWFEPSDSLHDFIREHASSGMEDELVRPRRAVPRGGSSYMALGKLAKFAMTTEDHIRTIAGENGVAHRDRGVGIEFPKRSANEILAALRRTLPKDRLWF